jgi:antitoxin (DNA-binding transcriptional repressor) of toxin-antitoxin stability system
MKTASVTPSKNGLSSLLRAVKAGKSVLIFDRNVPVARLEPIDATTLPDDVRLRALERQGLIRRALKPGSPLKSLKTPRPHLKSGASVVEALVAERNEAIR